MKEIVVISGKGGTGKTSLTAAFAYLAGEDVILADCDVDAADMHLLMKPDVVRKENFHSGETAQIIQEKCTLCGKCQEVCRFGAIKFEKEQYNQEDSTYLWYWLWLWLLNRLHLFSLFLFQHEPL